MAYRTQNTKVNDSLQPPQSLDAEQAVLGSLLKDSDAVFQAIEVINNPDLFYYPKHQIIYRAIMELYEKSEPCDITTVSNVLLKDNNLEKIGGRLYLVELVEGVI